MMPLTSDQREIVVGELKRIGASLNLSDDQKQKLQTFMTEAADKVQEYRKQNPNATQMDLIKKVTENRAALRQRLVNFLTPDQLTKWDAEVANAKEFLGQKLAA
jgi:anti-sigma regulatory factor (Ser/Thr protein kinase)